MPDCTRNRTQCLPDQLHSSDDAGPCAEHTQARAEPNGHIGMMGRSSQGPPPAPTTQFFHTDIGNFAIVSALLELLSGWKSPKCISVPLADDHGAGRICDLCSAASSLVVFVGEIFFDVSPLAKSNPLLRRLIRVRVLRAESDKCSGWERRDLDPDPPFVGLSMQCRKNSISVCPLHATGRLTGHVGPPTVARNLKRVNAHGNNLHLASDGGLSAGGSKAEVAIG